MAFKKTVMLQQHTPLIHFQHQQDGATLRATEFKPKLDKYIWQKWIREEGSDKLAFEKYCHYMVGYSAKVRDDLWKKFKTDYRALNYKVQIIPVSKEKHIELPKSYPNFFANMGIKNPEELKAFSMFDKLRVTFKSFFDSLFDVIEDSLPDFLMNNNFGTRQSKGFGSFYIHPDENIYTPPHLSYAFSIDLAEYENTKEADIQKRIFTVIDRFYRALRSGINIKGQENPPDNDSIISRPTDFYFKSLLFFYLRYKKEKQWDKKTIKDHFYLDKETFKMYKRMNNGSSMKVFEKGPQGQAQDHPDPEGALLWEENDQDNAQLYLFRDLFGLSSEQSWHTYSKDKITKHHIDENGQEIKKEEDEHIARFPSPIFFKPILRRDINICYVFFKAKNINAKFRQASFRVKSKKFERRNKALNLPVYSDFDFDDFFNYIFNKSNLDISNYVDDEFKDYKERSDKTGESYYADLASIFSQLQKSNRNA